MQPFARHTGRSTWTLQLLSPVPSHLTKHQRRLSQDSFPKAGSCAELVAAMEQSFATGRLLASAAGWIWTRAASSTGFSNSRRFPAQGSGAAFLTAMASILIRGRGTRLAEYVVDTVGPTAS